MESPIKTVATGIAIGESQRAAHTGAAATVAATTGKIVPFRVSGLEIGGDHAWRRLDDDASAFLLPVAGLWRVCRAAGYWLRRHCYPFPTSRRGRAIRPLQIGSDEDDTQKILLMSLQYTAMYSASGVRLVIGVLVATAGMELLSGATESDPRPIGMKQTRRPTS